MMLGAVTPLQPKCRTMAPSSQDGGILATLSADLCNVAEVPWPDVVKAASQGDAQPRWLPDVLVIALANSYALAEEEFFLSAEIV